MYVRKYLEYIHVTLGTWHCPLQHCIKHILSYSLLPFGCNCDHVEGKILQVVMGNHGCSHRPQDQLDVSLRHSCWQWWTGPNCNLSPPLRKKSPWWRFSSVIANLARMLQTLCLWHPNFATVALEADRKCLQCQISSCELTVHQLYIILTWLTLRIKRNTQCHVFQWCWLTGNVSWVTGYTAAR